jgi:hypothetical protein
MSSTGCQPQGTQHGRADLYRPGFPIALGEIKPFGFAERFGVPEIEHYIRRAGQSMDRRFQSSVAGGCGSDPAGADDQSFARTVGASAVRPSFTRMTGILANDTRIGAFDGDPARTLKARLVVPGVVGYWCTGGGSNTFTCGASEEQLNAFLDGALGPAQELLDRFLDEQVSQRLDRMIDRMDLSALLALVQSRFGPQIQQALGPYLGYLTSVVPGGTMQGVVGYLQGQIGPTMRVVVRTLARRLKSILLNELRLRLRAALRQILQELLVALCVGAPVVTLAQLLDRLTEELRRRTRQLIPVIVTAAVAAFVREVLSRLEAMLQEMVSALGRVVTAILGVVARILAVVALIVVVLVAIVLAVLGLLAIFDPVPGDEVALGAAATALFALVPALGRYIATGSTAEQGS